MDRDAVNLPAGLSPEDDRDLARLARGIAERGLTAPAIVALSCLKPAAFLGGQALRFIAPLLTTAAGGRDWDRFAQLLEVRGSVERLLAHLEALPLALAEREPRPIPAGSAYVIVDCGSTTTKAVLLAHREGRYRLAGRAEAPTTVEAPVEDVMVGVRAALRLLQDQTGHVILADDGTGLAAARGPAAGVGAFLATSSAGGGLQMLVVGLVRAMTAASAERAALGAGAIVIDVVAWNDDEDASSRLRRLRRCRPDMVLLAGGADDGAVTQVVALAELLVAADLRPRWGDGPLPVVFAGNRHAAPAVIATFGERAEVAVAANLRPDLETERLQPVRRVLHDVFLRHVMARAPGYPDLQRLCTAPVVPTPAAFGEALDLLADSQGGQAVAVDLGGATCDVFSVRDGQVFRSVSANLGLSFSLGAVCQRAGWGNVARWLPFAVDEGDLRDRVRNKMIRPTTLPQTPEDLLLEQAAAREALRLALLDHDRALQPLRGGRDGPTGVDALLEPESPPTGVSWPAVRLLLGSGGPLAHAPARRQAAAILIDACRPEGVTELAVDSVFVLPHLGVLRQVDADAAAVVLAADAIVGLGTCIAPVGDRPAPANALLADVSIADAQGGGDPVTLILHGGELIRVALDAGEERQVEVAPRAGWDFGAGPGRAVQALVRGGEAGLVLDGRGRELPWPAAELDRRTLARSWLAALSALPEGMSA
ncbi:MAG TPA: glutamate mutase L [Candidatus Krumholzibacteria bacterium]|nr:glutamate mutase L [Candidatus Krumholzibacteria bacterium]HPD71724.1 glutamate mutase L [Candidatus Krumholzibacteria bacterium]HRY41343.1 glutamate mutase L [Candidatus Krumholzibacteria bacterium]